MSENGGRDTGFEKRESGYVNPESYKRKPSEGQSEEQGDVEKDDHTIRADARE